MNTDWRESFRAFALAVAARLELGEHQYCGRTFDLPPTAIIAEAQAELLDNAAYSFIAWLRLEQLRQHLEGQALEAGLKRILSLKRRRGPRRREPEPPAMFFVPGVNHATLGFERTREEPVPNASAARDVAGDTDQSIGAPLSDGPELEETVVHDPQHAAGGVPAVSGLREIRVHVELVKTHEEIPAAAIDAVVERLDRASESTTLMPLGGRYTINVGALRLGAKTNLTKAKRPVSESQRAVLVERLARARAARVSGSQKIIEPNNKKGPSLKRS